MARTEITRRQDHRDGLRYASDLTDAEWELVAPFMPAPSRIGRPRETDLRAVVNAILYMASTGCQWRQLPKEFSPYSTVQGYFYEWSRDGRFAAINHALVIAMREKAGREASPTAGDCQESWDCRESCVRGKDPIRHHVRRKVRQSMMVNPAPHTRFLTVPLTSFRGRLLGANTSGTGGL